MIEDQIALMHASYDFAMQNLDILKEDGSYDQDEMNRRADLLFKDIEDQYENAGSNFVSFESMYLKASTAKKMKLIKKSNKAQAMTEYVIVVALIAVASIGITRVLGQSVKKQITNITYAIQGQKRELKMQESIDAKYFKKSDLSNFFEQAASSKADEN